MVRNTLVATTLIIFLFTGVNPGRAADLAALKGDYEQSALKTQASVDAAVASSFLIYSNSLVTSESQLKNEGDLMGLLSVRAEQKRFAATREVPTAPAADLPEIVVQAQRAHFARIQQAEKTRDKNRLALAKEYRTRLDALKRQLTTEGKIEDALRVRTEIENMDSVVALLSSEVPPTPAESATEKPTAIPKPPTAVPDKVITDKFTFQNPAEALKVLELSPDYAAIKGNLLKLGWQTLSYGYGTRPYAVPHEGWVSTQAEYTGDVIIKIKGNGWGELRIELFGLTFTSSSLSHPMPKAKNSTYTLKRTGNRIMMFAGDWLTNLNEAIWKAEIPEECRDQPSKIVLGNSGVDPGLKIQSIEISHLPTKK